jgi:hypothetical protein
MTTTQNTPHDHSISFFIGTQPDTERDAYLGCHVSPSIAYWRDGVSTFIWNLVTPVPSDDLRVIALLEFGMEIPDEPLPSPDEGWELLHDDPTTYTVDHLHTKYIEETPAEPSEEDAWLGTYGDAKIITPFNEADYKGRLITVTIGSNQFSKAWKPQQLPLAGLIHQFTKHQIGKKDGLAIVLADMVAGQRVKKAVKTCTAIGLDIDNGVPTKVIDAALAKLGCLAIRATTHSNGKTSSEISKDEILKYHEGAQEITSEMIQQFLLVKKHWDQGIVDTIELVEEDHTDKGIVCRISHDPMEKHRVIVPLLEPYVIKDEGNTQIEAMAKWAKVPAAMAELLGVPFDRSCTDPSRLYYLARHDKDRPYSISLFGGPLFNHDALQLGSVFDKLEAEFAKSGGSKSVTPWGKQHGKWWMMYAHGFQIMDVIDHHCPDKKRSKASAGYNIECPFDSDHSNAGDTQDQACFAVNAAETGGNEFFTIKCQHAGCQDKTALDMLGKMIEDEWFPESEITNHDFNIAEIEDAPDPKAAEMLLTLAEYKKQIDDLKTGEDRDVWLHERDIWIPMVKAITEAKHLVPGDLKAFKDALIKRVKSLTPSVLAQEIKLFSKVTPSPDADPKAQKQSERVRTEIANLFGPTFALPVLHFGSEEVRCELIDGRPWYEGPTTNEEGHTEYKTLCTPFELVGVVRYVDKDCEEALRVRLLNGDNHVVTVECDASALVKYKGSEVIADMVAKGWRCEEEGEKAVIRYFKTQQRSTSKVYHRSGCREGIFVLANEAVIAPEGLAANVELHPDSRLKGPIKAGSLEECKKALAVIFGESESADAENEPTEYRKPSKLWHHQVGVLLGKVGPALGYLGLESIQAHLGGGTTHSKTAAMMNGGAAWATPLAVGSGDAHEGCVRNAAGTLNSYENVMQKMSCMMLGLDEFGKLAPKDQAEFAFKVQGGRGKGRMGKDTSEKALKQWHGLVVVTAAENSIGQILAVANQRFDPGMTARLLPVNFSDTVYFDKDSVEWKAVLALHANYGHSGEAFIRTMVGIDKGEIRKVLAEFVDRLCEVNSKTIAGNADGKPTALELRASANVAYVWLAAELAIAAKLIPETYDPEPLARKLWLDFLLSDTAPIEPAERAFETLMSNLTGGKGLDIVGFDDREKPRSREALAYHSVPQNGEASPYAELYYVIPAKNLGKLSGNNGSPDVLRRMLDHRGYLVRPNGDRGKKAMTHPTFPKLGRGPFIVLNAEKVDEPEPEGKTDSKADGESEV